MTSDEQLDNIVDMMPKHAPGAGTGGAKAYPPEVKNAVAGWTIKCGYTPEHAKRLLNAKLRYNVSSYAIRNWIKEYKQDDVGEMALRLESLELAFAKLQQQVSAVR